MISDHSHDGLPRAVDLRICLVAAVGGVALLIGVAVVAIEVAWRVL